MSAERNPNHADTPAPVSHPRPTDRRLYMSTKRSNLPPITEQDLVERPDSVRRTPNGGNAWKCHYCDEFASSETNKGLYVCRRHGGTTPRQRDPARATEAAHRGELVRPPGRPMTTGEHSRSPRLNVNELLSEFRHELGEAEATDEHMIYLHSHLELISSQREDEEDILELLTHLLSHVQNVTTYFRQRPSMHNPEDAHIAIHTLLNLAQALPAYHERYKRFAKLTKEIEKRHQQFIQLSKILIETREKNAAANQIQEFTQYLPRVLMLLEQRTDPTTRNELKFRLEQEFSTIPLRALIPNTAATPIRHDSPKFDYKGPMLESLSARFVAMGKSARDLENTQVHMLNLRAYTRTMNQLADPVRDLAEALNQLEYEVEQFLNQMGIGRDGHPQTVATILGSYKTLNIVQGLQRHLNQFRLLLKRFDIDQERRHVRMIELADVCADIKLKAQNTHRLDLQRHLLKRLHKVLVDVLTPEDASYVTVQLLETTPHTPTPDQRIEVTHGVSRPQLTADGEMTYDYSGEDQEERQ